MWDAFCEHLRTCGRSGSLFVAIMVLIFVGALFGLPGISVVLALLGGYLLWFCAQLHQHQDRFEPLGRQPPLAATDLRTARTRLAKSQTQRMAASSSQRLKTQRLGGGPRPANNTTAQPLRLRPR